MVNKFSNNSRFCGVCWFVRLLFVVLLVHFIVFYVHLSDHLAVKVIHKWKTKREKRCLKRFSSGGIHLFAFSHGIFVSWILNLRVTICDFCRQMSWRKNTTITTKKKKINTIRPVQQQQQHSTKHWQKSKRIKLHCISMAHVMCDLVSIFTKAASAMMMIMGVK